jgi:hypothetical protein
MVSIRAAGRNGSGGGQAAKIDQAEGLAGERRNGKMAERTQAEKPNNFKVSAPAAKPRPKMAA